MLNDKDRQRIINEESAKFLEPGFGGLDLSSFPDLQKLPPEELPEHFDRSGLSRVNGLRDLIENPDQEALAQLAKEDPQLAAQLQSDTATRVSQEFRRRHPEYIASEFNFDQILRFLLPKIGRDLRSFNDSEEAVMVLMSANLWTLPEIEGAYQQLLRDGELEVPANQPRNLSAAEKIRIEQIVASGDLLGGIIEYVKGRVGQDVADQITFNLADPEAFASDPANRPIFEEAAWFCWIAARPAFAPTPERIAAMKRHMAGRFVNIPLLDAAWAAVQEAEKASNRSALLHGIQNSAETKQPTPADFDEMSDEEIARLKSAALREFARQQRRRV